MKSLTAVLTLASLVWGCDARAEQPSISRPDGPTYKIRVKIDDV